MLLSGVWNYFNILEGKLNYFKHLQQKGHLQLKKYMLWCIGLKDGLESFAHVDL